MEPPRLLPVIRQDVANERVGDLSTGILRIIGKDSYDGNDGKKSEGALRIAPSDRQFSGQSRIHYPLALLTAPFGQF
jgi:hypothetical protein